jgi:hypothetical protein
MDVVTDPPWEIAAATAGQRVASNGQTQVVVCEADATVFRRRAVRGLAQRPAGELVLPQINQLAGELLSNPDVSAAELTSRLHAIAATCRPVPTQRVEWLVVRVGDVNVYASGQTVVVSRSDLQP